MRELAVEPGTRGNTSNICVFLHVSPIKEGLISPDSLIRMICRTLMYITIVSYIRTGEIRDYS